MARRSGKCLGTWVWKEGVNCLGKKPTIQQNKGASEWKVFRDLGREGRSQWLEKKPTIQQNKCALEWKESDDLRTANRSRWLEKKNNPTEKARVGLESI